MFLLFRKKFIDHKKKPFSRFQREKVSLRKLLDVTVLGYILDKLNTFPHDIQNMDNTTAVTRASSTKTSVDVFTSLKDGTKANTSKHTLVMLVSVILSTCFFVTLRTIFTSAGTTSNTI